MVLNHLAATAPYKFPDPEAISRRWDIQDPSQWLLVGKPLLGNFERRSAQKNKYRIRNDYDEQPIRWHSACELLNPVPLRGIAQKKKEEKDSTFDRKLHKVSAVHLWIIGRRIVHSAVERYDNAIL